jgi:SAM-dependent methyltransferase
LKPDKPKKLNKPEKPEKPASVFRKEYADQYDLLYTDKDYEAECDIIEEVFRRYGNGNIKTILDLGCGTGNHAIPLAKRGYEVTGVDISPDMIRIASRKADNLFEGDLTRQTKETKKTKETGIIKPVFLQGDVRSFDLGKTFDTVLMMFAVLGYQTTNEDVLAALQTVRRHLNPDGLFICDVWYGPAVLTVGPSDRVKHINSEKERIIRTVTTNLDVLSHLAEVHYHVLAIEGQSVVQETEEDHKMRYFFPQELVFLLSQANLKMLGLFDFQEMGRTPTTADWNVICIGQG